MARLQVILTALALTLASCSPGASDDVAPLPATKLGAQPSARLTIGRDNYATGRWIVGPEVESHRFNFQFHSPWELIRPGAYRVPAGVVKFSLGEGPLPDGRVRVGFVAKAGESYLVTFDRATGVKVVERGTGKVARKPLMRSIGPVAPH